MTEQLITTTIWALIHVIGLAVMLVLRQRSRQQLQATEWWRDHAEEKDQQEAADLVVLARDRHRLVTALTLAAGSYLVLGVLALSMLALAWTTPLVYQVLARIILIGGEVVWIGAAYLSVLTGDRLSRTKVRQP
jgi:Mg2+/citrate symporter